MSTKTEIVNRALGMLGQGRLTDLDTATSSIGKHAREIYEQTAKEVMASYPWSTAVYRRTLAADTTVPNHYYSKKYPFPTNPELLMLLRASDGHTTNFDYAQEGMSLVTDAEAVYVTYIGYIENPGEYGIHLETAIVSRLAAALTYDATSSAAHEQRAYLKYEDVLGRMRALDGGHEKYAHEDEPGVIRYLDELLDVRK